jgi:hypothetical protein
MAGPYFSLIIARFLVNGGNRVVNGAQSTTLPPGGIALLPGGHLLYYEFAIRF